MSSQLDQLRIGILGAGWAAQSHAAAFNRLPDVAVTALWNRTRSKTETFAGQLTDTTPQIYDRWQDLIERADIDVLSVATAQTLRRAPIFAALERGLHVLIEKPIALAFDDAKAIAEAVQRSDSVVAVCLTTRYAPGIQAARQAMRDDVIGKLLSFQTGWWLGMKPSELQKQYPWWTDERAVLTGVGSHEFDRVHFLTGGDIARLTGRVMPGVLSDEPDAMLPGTYLLFAELDSGVVGQLQSTFTPGDNRWEIVLFGERGWIKADNQQAVRQLASETEPTPLPIPATAQLPEDVTVFAHTWNQLIADFVQAIRSGDKAHESVPLLPTIHDGLRNQKVTEAAMRAEAEARWIKLTEVR